MKKRFEIVDNVNLKQFLLALVMLVSVAASAQQDPEVAKALRLIELDKPSQAISTLEKAITSNPAPAPLYYYLGYAQIKNGEREKAKATFTKGIAADEKQALNYVGKGLIALQEKQATDAKALFDKALALTKSKDVTVLQAISEAYLGSNQTAKDAMPLLEKAKKLDEKNAMTEVLLGDAFLGVNNGGSAVSAYERAARLDPKIALPHYKIGLVYLRSKNVPVAEEAFNKAIAIDPEYTLAYKELGELYYLAKDGAKAVKNYEVYMAHSEKAEQNRTRYAFFIFMSKDFARANKEFAAIVAKPDVPPIALKYYAASLFESGNLEESQKAFDRYFSVQNENAEASEFAYYGKLLQKTGKDSLAVVNFQKSLEIEPNQPEIRELAAETLFKLKRYNDAIPQYRALIPLRTKPSPKDYFNLGRAFYLTEQYAPADSAFTKLIEIQPNLPASYLWDARAKAGLDPESEAGLAKPVYELLIEKSLAVPEKSNKKDLMEAYSYLGYYYFLKSDRKQSKANWEKVLAIDPNDVKATEAIKALQQQ